MDQLNEIKSKIFEVRGMRVMLDFDVADLYQVEPRILNQAYKRNAKRFPPDFAFKLTNSEWEDLRSQFVIFKFNKSKYLPLVYTEHGAWMLANILNSPVAIQTSIAIIRIFNEVKSQILDSTINLELWKAKKELDLTFSEDFSSLKDRLSQVELAVIQNCTDVGELRTKLREVIETLNNLITNSPTLPRNRKRMGLVPQKD